MSSKKAAMRTTTAVAVERRPHHHRYPTRWKLRHQDTPYIPIEVVFNILIYVPAKVLHEVMRYVCKQWYDIVSDPLFVIAHCQMSPPGFLIQDDQDPELLKVYYIEADTLTLNALEVQIPSSATILCSFNGLLLVSDRKNNGALILHVVNPVTKVKISLPPLAGFWKFCYCILALVGSSGHYKVGHIFYDEHRAEMKIFTIGLDKSWRDIDLQGIIPLKSSLFCLGFDVDTETFYQFSEPKGVVRNFCLAMLVNMGTSQGFINDIGSSIWRVWKLADGKSIEWTELARINVEPLHSQFNEKFGSISNDWGFHPFWIFKGHLWLYRRVKEEYVVVRYNLANESVSFLPIKIKLDDPTFRTHANTLVSPKNC